MNRIAAQLRSNAQNRSVLLKPPIALLPQLRLRLVTRLHVGSVPVRIGQSWSPPIFVGVILLPQLPDPAGVLGEQSLSPKAPSHGEALSAFAHQHDVSGVLHH